PEVKISTRPEVKRLHAEENKEEEDKEQQRGGVVDQLTERGITRRVAQRLANSYEIDHIRAKIDLVGWLVQAHPIAVGKNPAGYLRRAIEEDYQPPSDYKTRAERQAEAEQQRQRDEQRARQLELEQERERQQNEEERKLRERARKAFQQEHPPQQIPGTELTT